MSISAIDPQRVLSNYDEFADFAPISEPVTGGFSGAALYRIRSEGHLHTDLCLRCWPESSLPSARIRGLHRLLDSICTQGTVPVAVPLLTRHGQTICEHAGHLWQLEPWLPGCADYHVRPSTARLQAAMQALAAWHRAAAEFPANATEREWFFCQPAALSPAVYERLRRLRAWTHSRLRRLHNRLRSEADSRRAPRPATLATCMQHLVREAVPLLESAIPETTTELQFWLRRPVRLQPCLRDVWHDHILFQGDAVSGIIDPSAARSENIATDLSRLLGSLVGDSRQEWDVALTAYRRHNSLTTDEELLSDALDRSGTVLSLLNWIERTVESSSAARQAMRPAVPVSDRILQRCDRLLQRLRTHQNRAQGQARSGFGRS